MLQSEIPFSNEMNWEVPLLPPCPPHSSITSLRAIFWLVFLSCWAESCHMAAEWMLLARPVQNLRSRSPRIFFFVLSYSYSYSVSLHVTTWYPLVLLCGLIWKFTLSNKLFAAVLAYVVVGCFLRFWLCPHGKKIIPVLDCPIPVLGMKVKRDKSVINLFLKLRLSNNHVI